MKRKTAIYSLCLLVVIFGVIEVSSRFFSVHKNSEELKIPKVSVMENNQPGANWVRDCIAQNPEYKDMPITDRTEKSITFKRGDGKLVTQAVDFPIHYLDEFGQWQEIDTKLIYYPETDEWGAGGLNVRIKPDGTVRIIGDQGQTIHTQITDGFGTFNAETGQFISLGQFTNGSAHGDTLIRSIGNIEHKIKLTDLGVKEEMIFPSAPAGISDADFLAMKTEIGKKQLFPDGWLADKDLSEYHLPAPFSFDANQKPIPTKRYARYSDGIQYVYTGVPVSSLADVAYPVTIDPPYLDMTADGFINGYNASYATTRSTYNAYNVSANTMNIGQRYVSSKYYVYRGYLKFDTSAIPSGNTVTQVNLTMVCTIDNSVTDYDINIIKQDWSAQDPLVGGSGTEAAYDNCLTSAEDSSIWRNTNGMALNTQYTSGNLSTAWVAKAGYTYYSLASDRDYDGSGTTPTGNEYMNLGTQHNATESYRPILTVVHGSSNAAPDAPSSLAQYKSDCSTSISTGGWTNETSVCLKGYVNDTDASDQVKMQTESTTGSFTGTPNTTAAAYCADPCTSSVTVASLANGSQYRWQGRSIDDDSATSGFTQFNSGSLSFGIDTSAPTNVGISSVTADSTTQLTVASNTAADASSGLHATPYWFDETTGNSGGSDSTDWQAGTGFVDSGLSPNTQYTYRVKARDAVVNESSYSATSSKYTLANVPSAPTVSNPAESSLKVVINENSNPSNTTYAIYETTTGKYVDSTDGSLDLVSEDWKAYSSWGGASGITVTGLSTNTTYTFEVKAKNGDNVQTAFSATANGTTLSGIKSIDIVDGSGNSVGSPSISFSSKNFSFDTQDATATFGISSQKIRVDNETSTATWTANLAGSATTATWTSGSNHYDFNDGSGYTDGADADSYGGQMTVDPSTGTIAGVSGCSTSNVSVGASDSFVEGTNNSIDLFSAAAGASTPCKWDLTGVSLTQKIPASQPAGSYAINLVLTIQ